MNAETLSQKSKILSLLILSLALTTLSACSGNLIPGDATEPSKAHVVSLTRTSQRIQRFDCEGQLTSDKVEVVGSPRDYMSLHPTRSSWTHENISSSSFRDNTTKSSSKIIYDRVKFNINIDNTLLDMQVQPGINEIAYHFTFTDGEEEAGLRYIDIHYSTEFIPKLEEVHPQPEECPGA